MTAELTSEAWAQIRYDYEHTDRPVEDICAEHGISSGTLRDRARRWGWTRRRPPIPREGPPGVPAPQIDAAAPPLPGVHESYAAALSVAAAPQTETAAPDLAPSPPCAAGADAPGEGAAALVPRLQRSPACLPPSRRPSRGSVRAPPIRASSNAPPARSRR